MIRKDGKDIDVKTILENVFVSHKDIVRVSLLCVTTAQEGRVSDMRTRCHIDVEGRTRAKYPGIMLMPLWSGSLYSGSAAILAAGATASAQGRQALSRAGETLALPGKTGRNF
jgi:hypothetical protein